MSKHHTSSKQEEQSPKFVLNHQNQQLECDTFIAPILGHIPVELQKVPYKIDQKGVMQYYSVGKNPTDTPNFFEIRFFFQNTKGLQNETWSRETNEKFPTNLNRNNTQKIGRRRFVLVVVHPGI